jgi:hypothetical protein
MKRVGWITTGALVCSATAAAVAPFGCSSSSSSSPSPPITTAVADMKDPAACQSCHPQQYGDWLNSMHAFAAKDPVFRAMNARGQRETGGKLGNFWTQCHAPMAVKDKLTTDGTNLDSLDAGELGVTCFFCHNISAVGASHVNADVTLANDNTMRGEISDPVANSFHNSAYSALHDDGAHVEGGTPPNATMCGSCHDITTPLGAHIERTFAEYQTSVFNESTSCSANGNCHMSASTTLQPIAKGGKLRTYHGHDFPAIDVANEPSIPKSYADQVKTVTSTLSTAITGAVCVNNLNGVRVILDATGPGHNFPSGAAQDRRVWVEVVAEQNGQPFYTSGQIAAGGVVEPTAADPDLWVIRDQMFDGQNQKVSMFWQAACAQGNELIQIQSMTGPTAGATTHQLRYYPIPASGNPGDSKFAQRPDKVTIRVHMQTIGADVLSDLVDSGDLAPSAAQVTTLDVPLPAPNDAGALTLEWTADAATPGIPDITSGGVNTGVMMSCVSTYDFTLSSIPTIAPNPPSACSTLPRPDAGQSTAPVDGGADGAAEDLDAGAPGDGAQDASVTDATLSTQ